MKTVVSLDRRLTSRGHLNSGVKKCALEHILIILNVLILNVLIIPSLYFYFFLPLER